MAVLPWSMIEDCPGPARGRFAMRSMERCPILCPILSRWSAAPSSLVRPFHPFWQIAPDLPARTKRLCPDSAERTKRLYPDPPETTKRLYPDPAARSLSFKPFSGQFRGCKREGGRAPLRPRRPRPISPCSPSLPVHRGRLVGRVERKLLFHCRLGPQPHATPPHAHRALAPAQAWGGVSARVGLTRAGEVSPTRALTRPQAWAGVSPTRALT
jgi:hypothetical protein